MLGKRDNSGSNLLIGLVAVTIVMIGAATIYMRQPTTLDTPPVRGEPDPAETVKETIKIENPRYDDTDTTGQTVETGGETESTTGHLPKNGAATMEAQLFFCDSSGKILDQFLVTGGSVTSAAEEQWYLRMDTWIDVKNVETFTEAKVWWSLEGPGTASVFDRCSEPEIEQTGSQSWLAGSVDKVQITEGSLGGGDEWEIKIRVRLRVNDEYHEILPKPPYPGQKLMLEKVHGHWSIDWR